VPARPSVLIVLLALLLTGCAAGQQEEIPSAAVDGTRSALPSGPTPSPTPVPPASRLPSLPSVAPSPAVRTIDVAYVGGQVSGTTGREEVALGEQVVLRIHSDVADEVHVHGYDVQQSLPAGVAVEIPLTATVRGGYEVELHDAGRALFQLRVS
jgi:hypothetical protein